MQLGLLTEHPERGLLLFSHHNQTDMQSGGDITEHLQNALVLKTATGFEWYPSVSVFFALSIVNIGKMSIFPTYPQGGGLSQLQVPHSTFNLEMIQPYTYPRLRHYIF